jgi:hypothetical protein
MIERFSLHVSWPSSRLSACHPSRNRSQSSSVGSVFNTSTALGRLSTGLSL